MSARLSRRLKYELERLIVRGTLYRLLVIAMLLGLMSVVAGIIVFWAGAGPATPGSAIWWAFLRLSDPGYLGDDEGVLLRVVSTALTVLGFVIFVGALIATMTQWLLQTLRTLESGLTPIAANNHVLILGWTSRSAVVVRELLLAEGRVRRFLRRRGARRLRIVVLAEEVTAELVQELRDRLGRLWKERQVVFRSGSPLRNEHLRRVDFLNAAAVLLPAADFALGGAGASDTRVIKALLSMSNMPATDSAADQLPLAVAELHDARNVPVALRAYAGPVEVVAGDAVISRLIAQNVRHPGLSEVYGELLTHGRGNELYVREFAELTGRRVQDLAPLFPRAVPCGLVRSWRRSFRPLLNPPPGTTVEEGDRLVLLARRYEHAEPDSRTLAPPIERGLASPEVEHAGLRRLLVLGWSQKVPALLHEFGSYRDERFELDFLSLVPPDERQRQLARHDLAPEWVRHLEGDYTALSDLRRADPMGYDNVVLLGSDWLDSGAESDARTLLGYLLLRDLVPELEPRPCVLVELLDPGNVSLLRRRAGEVLISPLILSHMLAQVALRPELRAVFDELFGPGGAEIDFRSPAALGLEGGDPDWAAVQRAAAAHGETALGIRHSGEGGGPGSVQLNPSPTRSWRLGPEDAVVVLTTFEP